MGRGALGVGFGLMYTPAASKWEILEMFREARSRGLDVSVECYPYTAIQTTIESVVYNEGWQVAG